MAVRFSADGQDYTRTLSLGSISQFSISCWVKISTDRNAISTVWEVGHTDDFEYWTLQTNSDGTTMGVIPGSGGGFRATRAMTVGTWYWWGFSMSGESWTAVSRALTDTSFTVTTGSDGLSPITATLVQIGEHHVGGWWLNGSVAAVKLWTGAALTEAELQAEAWTYQPVRATNLRAWYPLTRAETTDYSGLGNTLSGGSGATTEDGPGISWRRGQRRNLRLSISSEATPGTLTAPWSLPGPDLSVGVTAAPDALIAPWTLPAPDVSITGAPPTNVQPDTLIAPWTLPLPDVGVSVTVEPAPLIGRWTLPTPTPSVPVNAGDGITGPGQLEINGFVLGGPGSPFGLLQLVGAGVDTPPIDNGNVPQPSDDGELSGDKLARGRLIEATWQIRAPKGDAFEEALEDFWNNTPTAEADEEIDVAIRILSQIYITRAAVIRRAAGIDKYTRQGLIKAAVLQLQSSKAELRSRDLGNAVIPDGGTVEVFHRGNKITKPIFRVPGPANGPRFEIERELADGRQDLAVIEFDFEVPEGQRLIIDADLATATIGEESKMRNLTGNSVAVKDAVLGRGTTSISYQTEGGHAPTATVLWRHWWV